MTALLAKHDGIGKQSKQSKAEQSKAEQSKASQ
jgi:hypothetical protein